MPHRKEVVVVASVRNHVTHCINYFGAKKLACRQQSWLRPKIDSSLMRPRTSVGLNPFGRIESCWYVSENYFFLCHGGPLKYFYLYLGEGRYQINHRHRALTFQLVELLRDVVLRWVKIR